MNNLIKIENGTALLTDETNQMIADIEKVTRELVEKRAKLVEKITQEMENNGVIKIDNDVLTITYIAPTNREVLNTKKLRRDLPDIYDDYVDIRPVKGSVRIKVKNNGNLED